MSEIHASDHLLGEALVFRGTEHLPLEAATPASDTCSVFLHLHRLSDLVASITHGFPNLVVYVRVGGDEQSFAAPKIRSLNGGEVDEVLTFTNVTPFWPMPDSGLLGMVKGAFFLSQSEPAPTKVAMKVVHREAGRWGPQDTVIGSFVVPLAVIESQPLEEFPITLQRSQLPKAPGTGNAVVSIRVVRDKRHSVAPERPSYHSGRRSTADDSQVDFGVYFLTLNVAQGAQISLPSSITSGSLASANAAVRLRAGSTMVQTSTVSSEGPVWAESLTVEVPGTAAAVFVDLLHESLSEQVVISSFALKTAKVKAGVLMKPQWKELYMLPSHPHSRRESEADAGILHVSGAAPPFDPRINAAFASKRKRLVDLDLAGLNQTKPDSEKYRRTARAGYLGSVLFSAQMVAASGSPTEPVRPLATPLAVELTDIRVVLDLVAIEGIDITNLLRRQPLPLPRPPTSIDYRAVVVEVSYQGRVLHTAAARADPSGCLTFDARQARLDTVLSGVQVGSQSLFLKVYASPVSFIGEEGSNFVRVLECLYPAPKQCVGVVHLKAKDLPLISAQEESAPAVKWVPVDCFAGRSFHLLYASQAMLPSLSRPVASTKVLMRRRKVNVCIGQALFAPLIETGGQVAWPTCKVVVSLGSRQVSSNPVGPSCFPSWFAILTLDVALLDGNAPPMYVELVSDRTCLAGHPFQLTAVQLGTWFWQSMGVNSAPAVLRFPVQSPPMMLLAFTLDDQPLPRFPQRHLTRRTLLPFSVSAEKTLRGAKADICELGSLKASWNLTSASRKSAHLVCREPPQTCDISVPDGEALAVLDLKVTFADGAVWFGAFVVHPQAAALVVAMGLSPLRLGGSLVDGPLTALQKRRPITQAKSDSWPLQPARDLIADPTERLCVVTDDVVVLPGKSKSLPSDANLMLKQLATLAAPQSETERDDVALGPLESTAACTFQLPGYSMGIEAPLDFVPCRMFSARAPAGEVRVACSSLQQAEAWTPIRVRGTFHLHVFDAREANLGDRHEVKKGGILNLIGLDSEEKAPGYHFFVRCKSKCDKSSPLKGRNPVIFQSFEIPFDMDVEPLTIGFTAGGQDLATANINLLERVTAPLLKRYVYAGEATLTEIIPLESRVAPNCTVNAKLEFVPEGLQAAHPFVPLTRVMGAPLEVRVALWRVENVHLESIPSKRKRDVLKGLRQRRQSAPRVDDRTAATDIVEQGKALLDLVPGPIKHLGYFLPDLSMVNLYVRLTCNGVQQDSSVFWGYHRGSIEYHWRFVFDLNAVLGKPALESVAADELADLDVTVEFKAHGLVAEDVTLAESSLDLSALLTSTSIEGRGSILENQQLRLRTPLSDDYVDITYDLHVLPASDASARPVGIGRNEPNKDPFLPTPEGGVEHSFAIANPLVRALSTGRRWIRVVGVVLGAVAVLSVLIPIVNAVRAVTG